MAAKPFSMQWLPRASTHHSSRRTTSLYVHLVFIVFLILCPPCQPVNNSTKENPSKGGGMEEEVSLDSDAYSMDLSSTSTQSSLGRFTTKTSSSGRNSNTNRLNTKLGAHEKIIKEQDFSPFSVHQPKNSTSRSTKVIIDTKQGRMGGIAVNREGQVTTTFLGVPYAAPPIGDLRFKPPEKHSWKQEKGWSFRTIWNATKAKPACPRDPIAWQYPLSLDSLYGDMVSEVETSEDCLYINVFIPRNLSKLEHINTLGLPVMVHLHDGHIRMEHSMLRNAWRFARDGNVIVATVSFRVGVLGYFSLLSPEAEGNFGLLDQSLALHWIWDNIREFGGDPEKITIYGSGLGGMSVGYHVISPQSRGMFIRAISQSGSLLSDCCRHRDPVNAAKALSDRLNCPSAPYSSMLSCLRKVPLGHLMAASEKLIQKHGHWFPVIDGKFIPDEPLKLLQNNRFNPVDYIIGANSHDGYSILKDMHTDLERDVSNDGFEDIIRLFVKKYFSVNIEQVTRALLTEYHFCALNVTQLGNNLVSFLTDMDYFAPAELAARYLSRNINRRVYLYEFAHRPSYTSPARPPFVSAVTLDDLEFVSGDVKYVIGNVTQGERALSEALMSAWANFAHTGDPNPISAGHGLRWDRFTESERNYVYFDSKLSSSNLRSNLRPRQMTLWNDYLRHLGEIPTMCSNARDHCERGMRPVTEYHSKVNSAMWFLIVLVLILIGVVAFLAAKLWVPPETWERCKWRRPAKNSLEAETKKLHPLPYCDEPT